MNETMTTLSTGAASAPSEPGRSRTMSCNAVLEAGKYAPSGANQQSALLIVVQDPQARATITRMNQAVNGSDDDPYYGAPTIILVLADPTKVAPVQDASLALGNMFNAACSLGLGSCWINRERQMFETDEGERCSRRGA